MNLELVGALNELEKERGISKEILREAIEAAIISAYKRNQPGTHNVRVEIDDRTGRIQVFAQKEVVEKVEDEANEISLEDARAIHPGYQLGDTVEIEVTPRDFGRIAAQTAKQVVIQRIREAERSLIYEEFANKEGDIVTGIVQRSEHRNVYVDLGKIEAVLPPSEQMPNDNYTHGTRLKVYVTEVRKTTKGPQVLISRTHPGLLKRLFELEVPEIHDGIVEIKAVAREAGQRSKIAVYSRNRQVDPVGACVGPRGVRVQAVVNELRGEKIDIVAWDPDPRRFIANALSPSKVVAVYPDPLTMSARAVVPDHQLSLAIGKEGQNARLAARLTGWKIDIKSESQHAELAVLEAQRAFDQAEAALRAKEAAQAREAEKEELPAAAELEVSREQEEREAVLAAGLAGDGAVVEDRAALEAELGADKAAETVEVPDVEDYADAELLLETEEEPLPEVALGEVEEALRDEPDKWSDEWKADEEDAFVDELLEPVDDSDLDDLRLEKEPPAPAKGRKSRAAKKAELKAVLEEEFLDEDEPLPTLFASDGAEEDFAAFREPAFSGPSSRGWNRKGGKKSQGKAKKKDLKDLAALFEQLEDEDE